jgi:molybdopterin molybdotransferase
MSTGTAGSALTVEQALLRILASCQAVRETERLGIAASLDRVLARAVVARLDVPPARNSAMDGYAVRAADARPGARLHVVGTAAAGHPWSGEIAPGECIRILTGAVAPASADAVLMQEDVEIDGDSILPTVAARLGDHIRERGEDTRTGQEILHAGRRLTAADIALLASQGIPEVEVHRRVRVSFFTTGDELVPIDQPLGPGQIHDSNRYALQALLQRYPVDVTDLGVIEDREEIVRETLQRAAEESDLILTTGGVSVGDADYVARVLQTQGEVNFWKIRMKPGRPLAFGRFGGALFLGLPGNPVSSMATFSLFVRPALLSLAGTESSPPWSFSARLAEDLKKTPGRTDYQRGILTREADGSWSVRSTGGQGSHQLRSMSVANAYIVLPQDAGDTAAGEWVEVIPFQSVF